MEQVQAFIAEYRELLWQGTLDTLAMIFISTFFAYLIGLPLGVVLYLTEGKQGRGSRILNTILGAIVNLGRSIPFIILLTAILPFTFWLVQTMIGVRATIVPLTVSAIPFVARVVEQSIRELPFGILEAAKAMGSTTWQLVYKVILPEVIPSLLSGVTLTLITLIGYSAMAGMVGGGGLGDIAIRYGYYRRENEVMLATIVIVVLLVQLIETLGRLLVRKVDKRRRS